MRRLLPLPSASVVLPLVLAAALGGCSTSKPSFYHQEDFSETDTYSRSFADSDANVCEAARRALLGQGYIISKAQANIIDGTKSFQPEADQHVEIAFHIVCVANGKADRNTSIFVSATQDRYALKKTNNSASLGVGVLGSVSMPFGSSDDSLVRVASETIRSPHFYDRFFGAVERYLIPGEDDAAKAGKTQLDGPVTLPQKKESP
ncbi:DUF2242 domain-containing protein [Herbaspirillum sp. RV1423]|uniref:DUF2242 domain-containing protein n=1 Tax=Herbaspirillum sp. RV1423 TaxID=1443993 RepID=UPI0004B44760|nr:DUF2242 domain-containing protein [Herbaspirillum sp. RV1423]